MKLKPFLTAAIVGVALALPSISSAAPMQVSVSLTEAPAVFTPGPPTAPITVTTLTATSGPSGENPTGEIVWNSNLLFFDSGPITCLAVSGNTATFNFASRELGGEIVTVHVVDDSPDTLSILRLQRVPTDCSPPPEEDVAPLTSADITVVDAQATPTTIDQCRHGGWQQFGFKNLGRCVAFVIQTRICDVLERHGHHPKFCPPAPPVASRR